MEALMMLSVAMSILINFAILRWKFGADRKLDASIDLLVLLLLTIVFGRSTAGVASAMIGGAFVSLYLLYKPIFINLSPVIGFYKDTIRVARITIKISMILAILALICYAIAMAFK